MGWIEALSTYNDTRTSFRAEDVLYFSEDTNNGGTHVILGRNGHQQQINIQTDYDEFKLQVDTIRQFKKDWANAMVQSEPVIAPLGQELQFANIPLMKGTAEEKEEAVNEIGRKNFINEDLSTGNYISFKEVFNFGEYGKRSKETNGWIQTFTHFPDDKINVNVRCDDNWGGARATVIDIDDIIELLPDKEQPE